MGQGTVARLDTAELAMEAEWHVHSTDHRDEFTRDGTTIVVDYNLDDTIGSAVKRHDDGRRESLDGRMDGKLELLRYWLTGRPAAATSTPTAGIKLPPHFAPKPGDWTREEFVAAVTNPRDAAFLRRLLELVDENDQLPSLGMHVRLYFGKRPGGAMFVYPFGRRHPPFKFSISQDSLMITGCWTGFPKVKGHPGFAELAALLGLSENGSATWVPVDGLDADEVWRIGERVSQAIN